jgi:putative transcriptional regulator
MSKGQVTRSLMTMDAPDPPPKMAGKDVVALRRKLRMSQAVFAATLNVSPKTIEAWEYGDRQPGQAALRLLQVIHHKPDVVAFILGSSGKRRVR